jgi:hypothetical protein
MTEEEQIIRRKISAELVKQFPDLNPKIAIVHENTFTYELEKHDNYTYYSVGYSVTPSGDLIVDWESAELTMF